MTDEDVHASFEEAEEIRNPLEGLVERTKSNRGAPFAPEVVEALAQLKKDDRAAFEVLRSELKGVDCRVTALDEALAPFLGEGHHELSQAETLLELSQDAELFHTPDGTAFADLNVNEHRETWPVRSKGFKRWLTRRYYEAEKGAPSSEAFHSVLNVIEAMALYDAPERIVYARVGLCEEAIYVDLGDEAWRAIEIDDKGWRVIDAPPVRFRRAAGMKPLPEPKPGGSIALLRDFLNVKVDEDFVLAVSWVLAALGPRGPYPVLALAGEQGSAKSSFAAFLRALVDPNTAPLRTLPREDRDLFITATNGHVLAFDNVSGLPAWLSDTLCRLATGGGFATRQLYTDQDEVLLDAVRPTILNGIEDFIARPDLADRAILLTLPPIPENERKLEGDLWADFATKAPHILGALLDAVSMGVKMLPQTKLSALPRMADFAQWVTACEQALWEPGAFMDAYAGNREATVESVIDADTVAVAVRGLMETRTLWTGTAANLLDELAAVADERAAKAKTWPDNPRKLRGRLRRAAPVLRQIGIEVIFPDHTDHSAPRTIILSRT